MTVFEVDTCPGPFRVMLSLDDAVLPDAVVAVPLCEQVPPAQEVVPACVADRPSSPVTVPEFENCPGDVFVTVPRLPTAPPYGPDGAAAMGTASPATTSILPRTYRTP